MEQDMKTAATRIRTIDLGYEQMMIFDDGRGERVLVLYGATWLTQEGQAGDAVLRPGEERALGDGRSLIEALEPSRLQILSEPAHGRSLVRGLLRRVRRGISRLQFGPVAPEPVA
jgi:Protein of unknown function (DUF2917)